MTSKQLWQDAIGVQDASNISGVIMSLARAVDILRTSGVRDSDALRRHPVMKMYAAKLIEMTEMGFAHDEAYAEAYAVCREMERSDA